MRNLFLFLWKYNFFIFFLFLEGVCGYLIVMNNNFQRASVVNSTNLLAVKVNTVVSSMTSYLSLREANDAMARENAALRTYIPDIYYLDSMINLVANDTIYKQQYSFMTAKVVNNSTNRRNNYLTLDRGSRQGVRPEMGVICSDGIVGIVKDVSEHYCSVISFLHKDSRFSVRIKKSGYIGSLVWDGVDPRQATLRDIAKHVKVVPGDSLVTSSFSAMFPEGILAGRVESVNSETGNNFQDIKVRLSTPFASLSYVYIVNNLFKDEQRALEDSTRHDR